MSEGSQPVPNLILLKQSVRFEGGISAAQELPRGANRPFFFCDGNLWIRRKYGVDKIVLCITLRTKIPGAGEGRIMLGT